MGSSSAPDPAKPTVYAPCGPIVDGSTTTAGAAIAVDTGLTLFFDVVFFAAAFFAGCFLFEPAGPPAEVSPAPTEAGADDFLLLLLLDPFLGASGLPFPAGSGGPEVRSGATPAFRSLSSLVDVGTTAATGAGAATATAEGVDAESGNGGAGSDMVGSVSLLFFPCPLFMVVGLADSKKLVELSSCLVDLQSEEADIPV